jgi:hypothetical protein
VWKKVPKSAKSGVLSHRWPTHRAEATNEDEHAQLRQLVIQVPLFQIDDEKNEPSSCQCQNEMQMVFKKYQVQSWILLSSDS